MTEGEYMGESVDRLPKLTTDQRAAALAKAIEARRERAAAKGAVRAGTVKPAEILESTEAPYSKIRVFEFLTACPGIGAVTARKIIVALGVSEGRRLRGLGPRQKSRLAEVVTAIANGEPATSAIRRTIGG